MSQRSNSGSPPPAGSSPTGSLVHFKKRIAREYVDPAQEQSASSSSSFDVPSPIQPTQEQQQQQVNINDSSFDDEQQFPIHQHIVPAPRIGEPIEDGPLDLSPSHQQAICCFGSPNTDRSNDSGVIDIGPIDLTISPLRDLKYFACARDIIPFSAFVRPASRSKTNSDFFYFSPAGHKSAKPKSAGNSKFICRECGKNYKSASQYRAHIRRHESKQTGRYSCKVCHKNFVQRSSLKTHERIHTGEKPYHCNLCNERFGDFSTFTKHRRTHTGEKPYQCPVCQRAFSQSGNMHRHLKVVHKNLFERLPKPEKMEE